MFDVGFSEIFIIGLVALIVLGPERLPKVARTAGHLLGRLQRYVGDVKADINREMQLEELRRLQAEVTDSARKIEDQVRSEFNSVHTSLSETSRQAVAELESTVQTAQNLVTTDTVTPSSITSTAAADTTSTPAAAPSSAHTNA